MKERSTSKIVEFTYDSSYEPVAGYRKIPKPFWMVRYLLHDHGLIPF